MLVLYIFILMFTNSINHLQKNIHSKFINRITIITLLFTTLLTLNNLYFQTIGKGISIYNGLFQITVQSHLIEIVLLLVGASILLGWPLGITKYNLDSGLQGSALLNKEKGVLGLPLGNNIESDVNSMEKQYSLIAIFSILGGSLLMSSLDLLSMYLSIELQSFALYILATLNKERLSATSAGLKYFLLGSLSSCFILLGSAIIYSYTGLTQLESINSLMSLTLGTWPHISLETTESLSYLLGLPLSESVSESSMINILGEGSRSQLMLDINKAFKIGLVLIIIGFLFKISAAPFYQWAPDVYDGTPTIVTVWLTIVVKLTILIFLLGLFEFTLPVISDFNSDLTAYGTQDFTLAENISSVSLDSFSITASAINGGLEIKNLLLISSLLSLLVGTIAGLSQIKIKRLLAFSSISHVGFLLLALGIFTQKSIDSFIFYLLQYSLTSLNIFLIVLAFGYLLAKSKYLTKTEAGLETASSQKQEREGHLDINYLIELKGQLYNNPVLSVSLAICLFSMAGIPPLIGFFSKQFVLFSSIENGNYFLSIVAILVSVISASYYLKLIKITFFDTLIDNTSEELSETKISSPFFLPLETKKVVRSQNTIESEDKLVLYPSPNTELFSTVHVSNMHSYIISILTFAILFFFIYPSIILNGTQLISLTIFNL